MTPGQYIWFYISVTEHHLLNREGHECEVNKKKLDFKYIALP